MLTMLIAILLAAGGAGLMAISVVGLRRKDADLEDLALNASEPTHNAIRRDRGAGGLGRPTATSGYTS